MRTSQWTERQTPASLYSILSTSPERERERVVNPCALLSISQTLHSTDSYRMLLRGAKNTKEVKICSQKSKSSRNKLDTQYTCYGELSESLFFENNTCAAVERKDNRSVFLSQVREEGGGKSQSLISRWKEIALQESVPPRILLDLYSLLSCLTPTSMLCLDVSWQRCSHPHNRHVCPDQSKLDSFCIPMRPLGNCRPDLHLVPFSFEKWFCSFSILCIITGSSFLIL